MSQQLPDVAPTEDPGGGGGMPAHSIMAAVMELQSLVEWTAQRKGVKEDVSVVNEKLRQLDKIRKELEKSARLQTSMSSSGTETTLIHSITDDNKKNEMDSLSSDPAIKSVGGPSDKMTTTLICDQDTSYHLPVQDLTKDVHTYSMCAMEDSFHLDDLPPPLDEHNCDSTLEENNVDLYINFVSAKEKIEKLTMDLEIEEEVKSSEKDSRHHATDEPDSLGTAISEDEGLGEESRRADSTGSNSFLDIHTSEEDLVDSSAAAPSVHYAKEAEPSSKTDVVWINDPQDPRLSVELCRCTIYKLKECLKTKEEQLKRIRDECKDSNQVKKLQTLVNNLKNEMEEMKSQLEAAQKEKSDLREQVLELEEAENDARRQCQRYEEKVLFLQEKDAHFQSEFVETKQTLDMYVSTLSSKDAKEKELRSQLKYMEVLVQKYEDQIKTLEASEFKLKQKMVELGEQLLKFQNSKSDVLHKGTQTYAERAKTEGHVSSKTSSDSCGKHCATPRDRIRHSKLSDASSRNSSIKSLSGFSASDTSRFSEIGVQANLFSCTKESETQTELDAQMCCESRSTTGEVQTPSDNSSVALAIELSCESASSNELETTLSSSCPFQQELFRRLHHLVEEDAHLQQQLHHMDQINLTLWQKLHNLEFHIGECKKENFQHNARMDDEARFSDPTSPVNVPLREHGSSHLPPDRSQSLDAGEEEHFLSSGKMMNLDFNEEGLKDRLLRLEQINSTFEAELRNREKLYQMKEQKHKEWMEAEDRFTCDIRYLQMEKNSLLAKVTQLEAERQRLTNKLLGMVDELACLQERHRRQISLMTEEHEALVSELRSRIELLTRKEKEYVVQISSLRSEKKPSRKEVAAGEKSELENLKASYVQLQIELSQNRSNMTKMENEFEEHLEALKRSHLDEEARLEEELQRLREKEADFNEQLITYQKRQSELEAALSDKEQQLEDARLEFKEQLLAMEEEHRTVETELNRKLRQMEESTAVATKALTEEKVRLEKELQENLYDLRTKEEQYKSRIAELEANVSQLHVELRRLTGDLDAGFPECDGTEFPPFQKERLQKQLQELQRREGDLREKLDEMEQKEAAYRETLENADRIVASVERGYKNKIEELEMSERSLKQRVNHLEEIESKLRVALHRERRSSDGRKPDDLVLELLEAEVRENTLKERIETLEQSQRSTTHRLKELEKIRETLESKMGDHEEIVTSLDRLQQEHDISRKEVAKLRLSESGLRLALQQAEGMLKNRETEMRNEMQRMQEEKKDLEETIHQLRMQVRQLQSLMDCNQEEEASGETLSESVHVPVVPETITPSNESEILGSIQPLKASSPKEEDHGSSDEVASRAKNVTFQENSKSSEDQLDGGSARADTFPAESEKSSSWENHCAEDAPLGTDDVRSGSTEVCDQGEDAISPTIEFFLPEPKKLQYELVETNIPEMQPVQEIINPLANIGKDLVATDTNAKEVTEIPVDITSTPKPSEQLQHSGLVSGDVSDEASKTETSVQAEAGSLQSEPSKLHSDTTETNALIEETAKNADQVTESTKESDLQSDGSHKPTMEGTTKDPSTVTEENSKNQLATSSESFSDDQNASETANASVIAGAARELLSESNSSNVSGATNTPDPITSDESREDKEMDINRQTCDIQLLNEELLMYTAAELSSEGNSTVPADSILKLLRGLRPGSAALGPYSQSGARPKTILKQYCGPDDATSELTTLDATEKALDDDDHVDWLKIAEESASRYEEEKKALEEEVQRLREKAQEVEREKEALQESLKKVDDVESLRKINAKLKEEVSLLQKRLKMGAPSDSIEATSKKERAKCLLTKLILKQDEVKTDNKSDQTPQEAVSVSSASGVVTSGLSRPLTASPTPYPGSTTGEARKLTISPPPPPPVDECRKERMQLEEDMIRAMVAMQFDMQQKKAAKKFNPAYGGSDTSTRPKVPVAQQEVVAMGACGSTAKEDLSSSSSSKRPTVYSPYNFRVVQQVGSDTVLVGWEHAHPTELEGFEVYVNGSLHETVYTPDRTKAVISGLDLQQQLTLSVCAISRSGDVSEPQLLHLPQKDSSSKDGFFFLDEDDDDYDDIFYVDEEIEKHSNSRPYSMEW